MRGDTMKTLTIIACLILFVILNVEIQAHGGRTDKFG